MLYFFTVCGRHINSGAHFSNSATPGYVAAPLAARTFSAAARASRSHGAGAPTPDGVPDPLQRARCSGADAGKGRVLAVRGGRKQNPECGKRTLEGNLRQNLKANRQQTRCARLRTCARFALDGLGQVLAPHAIICSRHQHHYRLLRGIIGSDRGIE